MATKKIVDFKQKSEQLTKQAVACAEICRLFGKSGDKNPTISDFAITVEIEPGKIECIKYCAEDFAEDFDNVEETERDPLSAPRYILSIAIRDALKHYRKSLDLLAEQ